MGRKRTKISPVGTRFETALIAAFGSVENACVHFKVSENSIGGYRRGEKLPGLKWKLRLESVNINYEWIITGKGARNNNSPPVSGVNTSADYVAELQSKLKRLEEENNILRGTLAPHLVQTLLEGAKHKIKSHGKK